MKQQDFRTVALQARARPVSMTMHSHRARLHDDEPKRAAAIQLCQDALDGWLALPDDAHVNSTNAARRKLREALGVLGAVTGRTGQAASR